MQYMVNKSSGLDTIDTISDWSSSNTYAQYDVVNHNNNFYVSKTSSNMGNQPPDTDNWSKATPKQFSYSDLSTYQEYDLLYEFSAKQSSYLSTIKQKVAELGSETITVGTNDTQLPIFDYTYDIPEEDLILDPLKPESFYHNKHVCNKITLTQFNSLDIQLARQSKQ